MLSFYEHHLSDDLVVQPGFSDWLDSVRREGKTFYTNLLWATVLERLARRNMLGVTRARADRVRIKVESTMYDATSGLYRSLEHGPQISTDGNLLAIDLGFTKHPQRLYQTLKHHELWSRAGGLPGTVTIPDYPRSSRNWTAWIAGLGHYHDRAAWSWITALSAKVAERMGDSAEAERILNGLAALAARDTTITEIYDPTRNMRPWHRWLYHSEQPFSWGAAATLEAAAFITAHRAGSNAAIA